MCAIVQVEFGVIALEICGMVRGEMFHVMNLWIRSYCSMSGSRVEVWGYGSLFASCCSHDVGLLTSWRLRLSRVSVSPFELDEKTVACFSITWLKCIYFTKHCNLYIVSPLIYHCGMSQTQRHDKRFDLLNCVHLHTPSSIRFLRHCSPRQSSVVYSR